MHACLREITCLVLLGSLAGCGPESSTHESEPAAAATASVAAPLLDAEAPPPSRRCVLRAPVALEPRGLRQSSGALTLARWGERDVALVADADEHAIHVLDTETMALLSTTELPASPAHVLVMGDGRVAVSLRYANRVALLQPAALPDAGLSPLCVEAIGREPLALAETEGELLVVSGFGSELVRASSDDLAVTQRIALPREPRGLLLARDRRVAWVSHMVGGVMSRVDLATNEAEAVVTYRRSQTEEEPSRSVQGFDLAAHVDGDGFERLLMPQVNSAPPSESAAIESVHYYGVTERTFNPWVAAVDAGSAEMLGVSTETSTSWRAICMLPRAAAVYGDRLFVACLDKGSIIEMDARFLDPMTAVYRQYRVAAGPTALAMTEDGTMFVWSLHGHELSRIHVPELDERDIAQVPAPPGTRLPIPRRAETEWSASRLVGRELFTARDNERVSGTGATCESCHPDGRDDGLLWRQGTSTLSLAGRLEGTAPFGWHGKEETLADRVNATMGRLRGKGLMRERDKPHLEGLLAFLETLPPPPPPLPHAPEARASIERGAHVFEKEMMCATCHPRGATSGSSSRIDGVVLDNPTLAFVAGTGPYFHDNRYPTLEALLTDAKQPMDQTVALSDAQRSDLARYLRSLPFGAVETLPALTGHWDVVTPGGASSWRRAELRAKMATTLEHPGRHLATKPRPLVLDEVPLATLPLQPSDARGVWLSLRNREGLLLGGRHTTDVALSSDEPPEGNVLRVLAAADGEPAIEMLVCPIGAKAWHYGTSVGYSVMCPERGTRFASVPVGNYGYALRTKLGGKDVLLTVGPDTFDLYSGGAIEDIGDSGRGWIDLHALVLAPGEHAELIRLDASEHWWKRARFPADADKSVINVSWPRGAERPQVLLATISST